MTLEASSESEPSYLQPQECNAVLVLEDGTIFWGHGAGSCTKNPVQTSGEICFNTSMTGYQEILTDPSYSGQIITFTCPHIGNVGSNKYDDEATKPAARGCVLSADITNPANWRASNHFNQWLKSHNLVAITNIDTRALTRRIRENGSINGVISYSKDKSLNIHNLIQTAKSLPSLEGQDLAKDVTCSQSYYWDETVWTIEKGHTKLKKHKYLVVALDFGIKRNILRSLASLGCKLLVMPADTPADTILLENPDGIFLSNGPGDPFATGAYAIPTITKLIESGLPIFGICLGHQMLAIALGAKTKKMHHGHRGGNHPVQNLKTGAVEITSQNHGFVVESDSIPSELEVTHRSLFDGTLEGIALNGKPVFSVQYHPEASPGPHDCHYLFESFINLMKT